MLLLTDLLERNESGTDTKGVKDKMKKLLRDVREPLETRASIETLNVKLLESLWELISDENYGKIDLAISGIRTKNLEKNSKSNIGSGQNQARISMPDITQNVNFLFISPFNFANFAMTPSNITTVNNDSSGIDVPIWTMIVVE